MRFTRTMRATVAAAGVLMLVSAACTTRSNPTLSITQPAKGATVAGNVASLHLSGSGVKIVPADGDTSGETGHYHIFIDRDPVPPGGVIPKEPGIIHSVDNPVSLMGLSVGAHRLVVVYGDGTHARIGDALAEVEVTVAGPSLKALATPGDGKATLALDAEGVEIVAPDGDGSGRTGHFHLFVDRDPTPAGQAIPKEEGIIHTTDSTVDVPLSSGEHTIVVVLGDGSHIPFDPPVMDKLVVTIP